MPTKVSGTRAPRRPDGKNLGYRPRYKEGYFPLPPMDQYQDLRSEMVLNLEKVGIKIEVHHHEVGTAGQSEIDMRYDTLLKTADNVLKYKYVVKNTAWKAGKTVTFMPKPLFMDNGSGMHTHQSLWARRREPVLGRGRLRGDQRHGPLLHRRTARARAVVARVHEPHDELVPPAGAGLRGADQPGVLRSGTARRASGSRCSRRAPREKRLEFRTPDPACNPYLAFSAMLMAGLDGIKNKIEPPEPMDKDLYDLPPEEKAMVKQVPGSLEEVLDNLEHDHQWLLEGGVFTQDVIDTWIEYKRIHELDAVRLRPHPYEFHLYYDI